MVASYSYACADSKGVGMGWCESITGLYIGFAFNKSSLPRLRLIRLMKIGLSYFKQLAEVRGSGKGDVKMGSGSASSTVNLLSFGTL